jgi:galactofuranosylgalactofuranosylrhamnosyl-N-acetylglucosaminyl-diphospho-decaprenol beta-1,5/1,6-galactofuranosyltransferase
MPELVLQRLVAAPPSKPQSLYFHARGPVGTSPAARSRFELADGSGIDFDTYFGAFFESHWRRHAALPGLRLRLRARGPVVARVWRDGGERELVGEARTDDSGTLEIAVPAAGAGDCRLSVTMAAPYGAAVIEDAAWVCDGAAAPVRLVLGFCAFGERERALGTARHLADDPELAGRVVRIVVVDQSGQPGGETLAGPGVDVVHQPNYGGTGGFTRVMLEALATAGATHVLLLDDDIDIDREVVHRIGAALAAMNQPRVIGGQMLDMLAPTILQEAGARLDRRRLRIEPNGRGVDAGSTLAPLMAAQRADYAAWFCCAVPLEAIGRCGLPLPFFINFDDVEFGLRLTAAGVPTVSLPGVCVWHMPGYAKDDDWRSYFYHRNMAVIAAVHGVAGIPHLTWTFAKRAAKALARGNLFRVALATEAIGDFLDGPDVLPASPDTALRRIGELRRRYGGEADSGSAAGLGESLALIGRAAFAQLRLLLLGRRAAAAWRQRAGTLTSPAWWQSYLGGTAPPAAPEDRRAA